MPWPVNENAPVPSQADYSPENVAPLMTFFAPLVSKVVGEQHTATSLKFRYENNTPDDPTDDIIVAHPGGDYVDPPLPTQKSPELLAYEAVAKRSTKLDDWRKQQPIVFDYFK